MTCTYTCTIKTRMILSHCGAYTVVHVQCISRDGNGHMHMSIYMYMYMYSVHEVL